ncbi:MAG: HNH endonuclease [Stappiaceae bacterium]
MARVPIFEGGRRRAPLHQSNFTVRARPEAFGAAAGRGLAALGQGVGDVGEAITTVADLRAQNALKNAQADYMEGARALVSDPETGFLSRTGSAALEGRAEIEAQLQDLGRRTAEGLPRRVQPQFKDFEIGYNTTLGGEMLRHEAQQTKVQTRAASERRISTLRQEAIRNHTDPVAHLASLAEAEEEVRTMAGWEGLSGEATEQMLAQHRDNVQSDIILQKAEADPFAAEVYYENVKDGLQEETRQQIDTVLQPTLTIARAEATASEITVGLNANGNGNLVHNTADSLVENVAKNANIHVEAANNDTPAGLAGNDAFTVPDPERAQRIERVRQRVRQRSDINALRLARAGVMLSPGNLLLSTILGAPMAIAVNRADPASPLASVLADELGLASDAPVRAELDSELGEATAGDLSAEFSKGAAIHVGGVDVEASLNGVADPEERSLVRNQLTAALTTQDRQRREAATARIQGAFAAIKEEGSLSSLSLEDRAELDGELRQAALEYQQAFAAGGDPKTDFVLAHVWARQFAEDPDGFSAVNIYKQRPRFSDAAFGVLESWHELARNGSDEADERAAEISSLIGEAGTSLTEAGIDLGNLNEEDGNKASRFLFRFLTDAYAFRLAKGRLPNTEEKLEIARQLRPLMPEVRADDTASDPRDSDVWRAAYDQALQDVDGDEEKAVQQADSAIARLSAALRDTAGNSEQSLAISDAVREQTGNPSVEREQGARAEPGGLSVPSSAITDAAIRTGFDEFQSSPEEGVQVASLYGSGSGIYGRYRGDGRIIEFPDGSRGPGGNFWDMQPTGLDDDEEIREFLSAVGNLILDFTPLVGDAKAFDEAEDGIDYAIATIGLLPGAGDLAAKVLKAARSASRVRRVGLRRPINYRFANQVYPLKKLNKELRRKYPHSVPFNGAGFPDFSRYSIKNVRIDLGNSRGVDFARADKAAGYGRGNPRPDDYTWHHHEDVGYMQLVPEDIHEAVRHTGGIATDK